MSVIVAVQSQTWTGTYNADASCDTSSFCCFTGGYTGWMVVAGNNGTFTPSSDSKTISVTHPVYPSCSGTLIRSGAMEQHSNIIIVPVLMFIGR